MADTPKDRSSENEPSSHDELRQFDQRLRRIERQLAQLLEKKDVADISVDQETLSDSDSAEHFNSDGPQADYPDRPGQRSPSPYRDSDSIVDAASVRMPVENEWASPAPSRNNVAPAATIIMGLTAAAAFVLAAVYFVKLVYDAGWLTPGLQVGLAAVSGIVLIATGVLFGRHDRSYAAYLPAVGVVVLYLAIFAGHLHYELFGVQFALGTVALTTLCAMWLARQFNNSVYILFAVVGVYITPILMDNLRASVLELVIYYTAWSLLFSFASIYEGRRIAYMLAMLFAIIGFDISWRLSGGNEWFLAVIYQAVQFVIFSATTYLFSSRHKLNLSGSEAAVHGVGLFYFYGVEYFTLSQHLPQFVPWIALASVVVVLMIYLVASKRLADDSRLRGSAVLASSYASFVTAHVVYFEMVPSEYFAWAALMAPLAAGFASRLFATRDARLPLYLVAGLVLVTGFVSALAGRSFFNGVIPQAPALLFVYSLVLYLGFFWLRRDLYSSRIATLVLYAAHTSFLVATLNAFDNDILISVAWGVFAVILLLWAIRQDDAVIGKSSLLIFAASGLKVLLHDLDGSAPMTRVLVLIVLSVSLYIGGWLYQKVNAVREFTGNPVVDRQITKIALLVSEGLTNERIALELLNQNEVLHGSDETWTANKVLEIRQSFAL